MEISLSRFLQLTALIAGAGTLATACTVNNIQESGTGGAAGATSSATGGASAGGSNGGASSTLVGGSTSAGASSVAGATSTAGASSTTTGGATNAAGASSTGGTATSGTAGSTNVAGSTATAGTSGVNGGSGNGGASQAGATNGGASATTGGSTSIAGGTGVAGSSATGGNSGTGGTAGSANGGMSATGGTAAGGSSASCVSGDPAGEGLGFDCTTLSYYSQQCDNPTGEGSALLPYGVTMCERYAAERVDAVKIFTDCLAGLTQPTSGWCGAEHMAQVDACLSQMLSRTCPSDSAQTACTNIHAACAAVTVAGCIADLSPLADSEVGTIEPCMEGAVASTCQYTYRGCVGYPDLTVAVADSCNQLVQACSGIDLTTCEASLDLYGSGVLYQSTLVSIVGCMQTAIDGGSPCAEAFTLCAP